jgi:hypothetical protein
MKARELRIGNLTDKGEIKSFFENGIHVGFGKCYLFSDLKPIPLTEEWLLRFGFDSSEYKDGYIGIDHKAGGIITDFVLTYPLKMGEWQKTFVWEHGKYKFTSLEFVHEIQNLYFALTGEELKLQDDDKRN